MLPKEVVEKLNEDFVNLKNIPVETGHDVQKELWAIADRYGVDRSDVFIQYLFWKSEQSKL